MGTFVICNAIQIFFLLFLENTRSMPRPIFYMDHYHENLNRSAYHMSRSVESTLRTLETKLRIISFISMGMFMLTGKRSFWQSLSVLVLTHWYSIRTIRRQLFLISSFS